MLGIVRAHVNDVHPRAILLLETAARVMKTQLREELRKARRKLRSTGSFIGFLFVILIVTVSCRHTAVQNGCLTVS